MQVDLPSIVTGGPINSISKRIVCIKVNQLN